MISELSSRPGALVSQSSVQLGWTDSLSQGSQKGSQGSECRPRRRNAGLQSSACAHSVLHSACNNKASSAW